MAGLVRGTAAREGRGRDLRADLFRGFALWFIFIDHVPGNWLADYTLRNFALCDATEAFVLLAGFAAAIAYGGAMQRGGWDFAAAAVLRRVGTLYIAHIFLFVVFTAQVGYSAAALDSTAYLDELNLDAFGQQPYRALLEALLLRFQPAFLNILPLYIVLLAALALVLPLLQRLWLLLGLSLALYAAVRLLQVNLPSWTGGGWFFNPLAWQALFFAGVALGQPQGPLHLPYRRSLAAFCLLLLLAGAAATAIAWHRPGLLARLPDWLATGISDIDKTSLHPARLASMLALTYLVGHWLPAGAAWLRGRWAAPWLLMGQQSLPVFCAGIFLSFLGRLALEVSDAWPMQLLVNALGLAALLAVGAVAAWYRSRTAQSRSRASLPAPAANPSVSP